MDSARRRLIIMASASSETNKDGKRREDDDKPAFNPFGFVTDNPSSRGAIQLPDSPAEDGNVGQMLYLADAGFHCFAPDWIGFGFSDKPRPGYGFNYTEEEFHVEFDKLIEVLGFESPFFLVVQGFLVGSYGLTWTLKNPSTVSKLAILNSPLTAASPIPGLFQQLRIPLYGEFTCQNAVMAERFIEAASSGPGFALLEAARKANFKDISSRIATGFSSGRLDKPVLLAWGISGKYIPQSVAEEFQKGNPNAVKLKLIDGAGYMPQEDW